MLTAIPIILKKGTQPKGFCNIIAYSFLFGHKVTKKISTFAQTFSIK